jgi:hypothetical protein
MDRSPRTRQAGSLTVPRRPTPPQYRNRHCRKSKGIRPRLTTQTTGAIPNHFEEGRPHIHHHAVVITPVQTPKRPAATVFESLDEAVPGSGWQVGFDGIVAGFVLQPDRAQVAFAAVRRFHKSACDKPYGSLHCAKAKRSSIRTIERDLAIRGHWAHFGYQEGKEF